MKGLVIKLEANEYQLFKQLANQERIFFTQEWLQGYVNIYYNKDDISKLERLGYLEG
jgi:hypothetical protein